uniref:Uncharacterized protein n=1 Tax=Rhizophora mucronata TaxID=61149 RepID=A0A2P2PN01_RHIMU
MPRQSPNKIATLTSLKITLENQTQYTPILQRKHPTSYITSRPITPKLQKLFRELSNSG